MRVGVHASIRNGFNAALDYADSLGCAAVQIFSQNPRGWRTRIYHEDEFISFRKKREKSKIKSVLVHSPYLPNLSSSNPEYYQKSRNHLIQDLDRAGRLGAEGLVIHPGGYSEGQTQKEGLSQLINALDAARSAVSNDVPILIENMAGGGRRIGARFEELKEIMDRVKNPEKIGICFDTCHAFAANYDLSSHRGVKETLERFDTVLGLNLIKAFHVNDSRDEQGSHLDRHESLGKGKIGLKGLKAFLGQTVFKDRVFILETPRRTPEEEKENLKILFEIGLTGGRH